MSSQKQTVTVQSLEKTAKGVYAFAVIDNGQKVPCNQIKREDWQRLAQQHNAGTLSAVSLTWQTKGKGKGHYVIK